MSTSLFAFCRFESLSLCWLSTHILIEKCTQGKSSGAFLVFQGAFPKKQGAFCGESGAFLKNRVHFGKAGCISRCRGLLWPFYNSHTLVLRKTMDLIYIWIVIFIRAIPYCV